MISPHLRSFPLVRMTIPSKNGLRGLQLQNQIRISRLSGGYCLVSESLLAPSPINFTFNRNGPLLSHVSPFESARTKMENGDSPRSIIQFNHWCCAYAFRRIHPAWPPFIGVACKIGEWETQFWYKAKVFMVQHKDDSRSANRSHSPESPPGHETRSVTSKVREVSRCECAHDLLDTFSHRLCGILHDVLICLNCDGSLWWRRCGLHPSLCQIPTHTQFLYTVCEPSKASTSLKCTHEAFQSDLQHDKWVWRKEGHRCLLNL